MSKTVTISGTNYTLPTQGTNPAWGKDLSDLLEAMIDTLTTISGTGDILTTTFTIANNQSSAANVTGLSFDVSSVRSAIVSYSVYRSTALPSEAGECGFLLLTYLSEANEWNISRYSNGDSGVTFTITNAGQVKYTSDDMTGGSYAGTMKFNARAFVQ